jgi:hypothetical protein
MRAGPALLTPQWRGRWRQLNARAPATAGGRPAALRLPCASARGRQDRGRPRRASTRYKSGERTACSQGLHATPRQGQQAAAARLRDGARRPASGRAPLAAGVLTSAPPGVPRARAAAGRSRGAVRRCGACSSARGQGRPSVGGRPSRRRPAVGPQRQAQHGVNGATKARVEGFGRHGASPEGPRRPGRALTARNQPCSPRGPAGAPCGAAAGAQGAPDRAPPAGCRTGLLLVSARARWPAGRRRCAAALPPRQERS